MEIMVKVELESPYLPVRPDPARMADKLETAFLTEMLKIAMPAQGTGVFGGGIGESQFSSFLTEQRAAAMAARLDLRLLSRSEVGHA